MNKKRKRKEGVEGREKDFGQALLFTPSDSHGDAYENAKYW